MTHDATKPRNIFEAASRLEKERREKGLQKQAPPQAAEPASGTSLSEIFQRCRQLHNDISQSLDQAFKSGGFTHTQLQAYVSRPQNFSEKDWRGLEEQKKKTDAMLKNLKLKIETPGEIQPPPQKPPTPTPGETPPKPPMPVPEEPPPQKPPTPAPGETPPKPPTPAPGETPPKPPQKKPKIMTRRHWIGM